MLFPRNSLPVITCWLTTFSFPLNSITDCYGRERLQEFRHTNFLDLLLVYGIEPAILQPVPGGRENAVMVHRRTMEALTLKHKTGKYYLRPDRIFGAVVVRASMLSIIESGTTTIEEHTKLIGDLAEECKQDIKNRMIIHEAYSRCQAIDQRIAASSKFVATNCKFPLPLPKPISFENKLALQAYHTSTHALKTLSKKNSFLRKKTTVQLPFANNGGNKDSWEESLIEAEARRSSVEIGESFGVEMTEKIDSRYIDEDVENPLGISTKRE